MQEDLPTGIAFRCDSRDEIHLGFDVMSSTDSWSPYGNVECQNDHILADWFGNMKRQWVARNKDVVTIYINKDRTIDFFINGVIKQTARDSVPVSAFPIDFVIASADPTGYIRSMYWVDVKYKAP